MLIPSKTANRLRELEEPLFLRPNLKRSIRQQVFFKAILPLLEWLRVKIRLNYDLEEDEITSELYLMSCDLFNTFNKNKSSIIPYLEKYIIFFAQKLETKLNRCTINKDGLLCRKDFTCIEEEYYWNKKDLLLGNKYISNVFTNSEKYIIINILELDDDKLTKAEIARKLKLNIKTTNRLIENLQTKWRNL